MATFSYYMHAKIVAWLKGGAFGTAPVSLKLALLTAAPNPDGTDVGSLEPSGDAGYSRQTVTLGSLTTDTGVTSVKNSAPLVFPTATADWASVTWAAVVDQDGNMLAYGPLPAARVAQTGDQISFGANAIQLRLR